MLYPDPKQRLVLGWRIRWIAGLFSLLMVAAGVGPLDAAARPSEDPQTVSIEACPVAESTDEQVSSAPIDPASDALVEFKSAAESEGEKAEEANASAATANAWLLARGVRRASAAALEDRSPRRIDADGRISPRAPPIA